MTLFWLRSLKRRVVSDKVKSTFDPYFCTRDSSCEPSGYSLDAFPADKLVY